MRIAPVLFCIALVGCGNSAGNDDRYANYAADRFMADCKKTVAPNVKAAKELDQLCTCTSNRLRSTIHRGDGDKVETDKMHQAQEACLKEVYPNG